MSRAGTSRPSRWSEREVVRCASRFLASAGYRVYANPDSTDYFDLVARRGDEVGLVEAKVTGARKVLLQALQRRAWGDWVAVVVPSPIAAERLAARTQGSRAAPVGVWAVDPAGQVQVVRAAGRWVRAGEDDPFAELRARFRSVLDRIDSGELPPDVRWGGVVGAVRRASGGRGFREWRLDEPPAGDG